LAIDQPLVARANSFRAERNSFKKIPSAACSGY